MSGREFIDMCSLKCRAVGGMVNQNYCSYHKRVFEIYENANEIQKLNERGIEDKENENDSDSHRLFIASQCAKIIKILVKELY